MISKLISPQPLNSSVSKSMRSNKGKNTGPEKKIREYLKYYGLRHYKLNKKGLPGTPDVCFMEEKIAIFINGCFWHRCPFCNHTLPKHNRTYWKNKFIRNQLRDAANRKMLKKMGWKPMIIWECKLKYHPASQMKRIFRAMKLQYTDTILQ